jgi:hypothetical protein
MLVSCACLLLTYLGPTALTLAPVSAAPDPTADASTQVSEANDDTIGVVGPSFIATAPPRPGEPPMPEVTPTRTDPAAADAPGIPPHSEPRRVRPRVGLGPIVWTAGDGSIVGRSSAGLAAQALSSAGVSRAHVLHPADADVFLTGTMSYDAMQHNPRSTGRGAIRAGIGILVGGTLAGLAAGLTLRYAFGAPSSFSNLVMGSVLAPSVLFGGGAILLGGRQRRAARRERAITWELTADLRVHVGAAPARLMKIRKRGSEACGADLDCEEGIAAARRKAIIGLGSSLSRGINLAAGGGAR